MGRDDDYDAYQADLELFHSQAHMTLVDLKYLVEVADRLGCLKDLQRSALGMALEALNEIFPTPDHQQEKPF